MIFVAFQIGVVPQYRWLFNKVKPMQAAFFDLDKTVIAKASVAAFGRTLYNEGLINSRLLLRIAAGHLIFLQMGAGHNRLEKMRMHMLTITRGWDRDQITSLVREAMAEVLEPIIYKEALELIEKHQSEGRHVVIISSSPEEIVKPMAEFLGADHAIGSQAMVEDGRYTGELSFYAYGPHKADAIRKMAEELDIDLANSYAYSDSHTDVPMLETVGNPVAVNPDKELLRVARFNKWPIVNFTHPMPSAEEQYNRRVRIATAGIASSAAMTVVVGGAFLRMARRAKQLQYQLDHHTH